LAAIEGSIVADIDATEPSKLPHGSHVQQHARTGSDHNGHYQLRSVKEAASLPMRPLSIARGSQGCPH
jgi:hypothetical protein